MTEYWPWWAGAVGLALVTINYTLTTDRSFGVSSAWDRVLHWRTERDRERLDAVDERVLAEALVAAAPVVPHVPPAGASPVIPASADEHPATAAPRPAPLVSQAALLVSIVLGGLVAAVTSGRFALRLDMGEGFREIVTASPVGMLAVLFTGGLLVGFGTRLAGGCSSGHGLSGCGRLRPVSLLATAVFFGTAVVVSFLLWKVI